MEIKGVEMTGKRLKTKIEEFHRVMESRSRFGAYDTEPRWQFKNSIRKALKGKQSVPKDARGWELFTDMPGVEAVASELTETCHFIVDDILASSISERKELIETAKYFGYEPLE